MKTYCYENYKTIYPQLSGSELTDALIIRAVNEYGICDDELHVIRDHRNKPYIAPRSEYKLNVSVSHCRDTFACIICETDCGIDIQMPGDVAIHKIAQRFFSEREQIMIEEDGEDMFYRLWTRKEAYAKYTGKGFGLVLAKTEVTELKDVMFIESMLENGMYCTVCLPKESE
ncbi:MAG: 4'-phosphopantetheinyl transferase superfamily protein [Bacillota bacterium]|nr:4'-phosphopantetheinyl transferase superfamily protein [Bacillota bacterium]